LRQLVHLSAAQRLLLFPHVDVVAGSVTRLSAHDAEIMNWPLHLDVALLAVQQCYINCGEFNYFKMVHFTTTITIYLIFPAALTPYAYSASNRNEYRKHKKKKTGQ
jgi:hypothetical protein